MARSFNGTNQRVSASTAIVSATPLTMACWFKAANVTTTGVLMSINRTTNSIHRYSILARGAEPGDPVAITIGDTSDTTFNTSSGYTANTWYHACGVFASPTSRSVYINGGSKVTNTVSRNPTSLGETHIGTRRAGDGLNFYFNGLIAIPAIWNVALTDDEVAMLAAGFRPDQVRPQNLISYNLFDPRILDLQGNAWTNTGSTDSFDDPPLR